MEKIFLYLLGLKQNTGYPGRGQFLSTTLSSDYRNIFDIFLFYRNCFTRLNPQLVHSVEQMKCLSWWTFAFSLWGNYAVLITCPGLPNINEPSLLNNHFILLEMCTPCRYVSNRKIQISV